MEAALDANQGEMSHECQLEIERSLGSLSMSQGPEAYLDDEESEMPRPNNPPVQSENQLLWLTIFLVIFFTAIGVYIAYVNNVLDKTFGKKSKKISKKKVM